MDNVIHRLTLDLTGPDVCPVVEVQRGDSARTLVISLTQGGRSYQISESLTAALYATKPDGNPLFNACSIENNQIRYDFTPQTANVAGAFDCEIWLVSGDKRELTTPRFGIVVDERMRTDDVIPESEPEYTAITEMVASGTAMIRDLREALAGLEGVDAILEAARSAAGEAKIAEANAKAARDDVLLAHSDAERLTSRAENAAKRAETAADKAEKASANPVHETVTLQTENAKDGENGVILTPEGTEHAPALVLYGLAGDEPVRIGNVAEAVDEQDVPNLGQVRKLVEKTGGLSATAAKLLVTILRSGVYSTDQSANITALETALSDSGGTDEPAEPETPESGVIDNGRTLVITGGVTVTDDGDTLRFA